MSEVSTEPAARARNEPKADRSDRVKSIERPSPLWLLLVEDDPGDQMLVKDIVKATNLDTKLTLVKDGEKAVRCIERWSGSDRPDLVLLDLNLPKRDAVEVLERIRRKDPTVRVAALTGFDMQSDVAKDWEGRVEGYLVKPIGLDEMDRTAERLKVLMQAIPPRGSF